MLNEQISGVLQEAKLHQTTKTIKLPGPDDARITKLAPNGEVTNVHFDDSKTIVEALERGCKISGNGRCVGWRSSNSQYSWITYNEFIMKAKSFGAGLHSLGIELGQSTLVGIYSQNSVEWVTAQFGCLYYSSPFVPLYDSLGTDACSYMINHGELKIIICDKERKVRALLEKKHKIPSLKHIICTNFVSDAVKTLARKTGVQLHEFSEIENIGRSSRILINLPKPSDVAEICYTSGTTGDPKGVIQTHENYISVVSAMILEMGEVAPTKSDVFISYLPLAHVLEQACQLTVFITGGCVGFFKGEVACLLDDMKVLQPTYFPAVPRLLNKLYDMAHTKRKNQRVNNAEDEMNTKKTTIDGEESFDEFRFFKFFSDSLGGKVKLVVTAAAPVSPHILNFFCQALKCNVVEFYGQTETTGPCTANVFSDQSFGNVGAPIACNQIKLIDVPSLGYFKKNGTGEVCVKGFSVMSGYYKDQKRTVETIDEYGWLHTGDIGSWQLNGTLKIIDRIKHLFKLSQGEYVVPEKLENIYLKSPYISQIFIHGDSLQSYLVAVVMPDEDVVMPWCKENLEISSWIDACNDTILKQLILNDMRRVAKTACLLSYEQVKKIHLCPKLLTHEDGHLTPTLKTKRSICQKVFAGEIHSMYSESMYSV